VITEYDWLNEPQHEDPCEHPKDSFIGSRRVIDPDDNYAIKWIDIYIFSTKYGPHVCLRISERGTDNTPRRRDLAPKRGPQGIRDQVSLHVIGLTKEQADKIQKELSEEMRERFSGIPKTGRVKCRGDS
jgi:hypothetical protein